MNREVKFNLKKKYLFFFGGGGGGGRGRVVGGSG